ncbi:MAG: hypothetical protein LAO08_01600 [Acidobacteriia bacterium]|nr:hypothetical protein [Terriglobia bacterium]
MLKALLVAVVINVVVGIPAASAKALPQGNCGSLDKQSLAQHEPKDWDSLYHLFRKFSACDGGAIGEQFSEDVAQLFSKQWGHLDKLSRLAAADKTFEQFVLRHIDTTLDESELLVMVDNSKLHCRAGDRRICGLVHAKAQESLDTLRNVSE